MGCTTSKAEAPSRSQDNFVQTGGGSIIIPALGRKVPVVDNDSVDELCQTRGGSMIVGRKDAGAWEPGSEIVRPESMNATETARIPTGDGGHLKVSYAAVTLQGRSPRPPNKPNQDSFVVSIGLGNSPSVCLFAVFDGHGPRGEDASNYCRINMPDLTVRHPSFSVSPFDALCASFEATHRKFTSPSTQRTGVDTQVSGSTAVAIMLNRREWICANAGDSRAAMGSRGGSDDGPISCQPLSSDHKPLRPDERARIMKAGARILSEKQLGIENGDSEKLYVCRVANGAIRYGVLFTRSIGDADAHTNLGLVSSPEVRRGTLSPLHDGPDGLVKGTDGYLVLATDGVWDHLSEADVNEIVMSRCGKLSGRDVGDNAMDAASSIADIARAKWDDAGDKRRDDITVLVVFLRGDSDVPVRRGGGASARPITSISSVSEFSSNGNDAATAEREEGLAVTTSEIIAEQIAEPFRASAGADGLIPCSTATS